MTNAHRHRKATDEELTRENSLGISLATIGHKFNCHPTTVAERLRNMNIPAADTRRAFMEDVLKSFTESQREWLADQLGPTHSVKDYVRNLILKEHNAQRSKGQRI